MEEKKEEIKNDTGDARNGEFKGYAAKRIAVGVLLTFAALWVFGTLLGLFNKSEPVHMTQTHESGKTTALHEAPSKDHGVAAQPAEKMHQTGHTASTEQAAEHEVPAGHGTEQAATAGHGTVVHTASAGHGTEQQAAAGHGTAPPPAAHTETPPAEEHGAPAFETRPYEPKGVAFINAVIKPLEYELTERFWGWRPNDILDFTDNVNNFQLGVLEVTRRTAVILAERISRTGSTAAFDKNLENAMNWFMIKADRYWFPSPETKYKAGLKELAIYREKLRRREAKFYTRTDNLIPLLMAYEDLLGSCDDNLVKTKEDDGSEVSHFKSDDYFFYARGVATALHSILEGILEDFHTVVDSRRGTEVLHHAIESCHHAMEIKPIYITNSSLGGILANHRANIAAPISHARFYIGLLIKTLST